MRSPSLVVAKTMFSSDYFHLSIEQPMWIYILAIVVNEKMSVPFAVSTCPWCDLASGTVTSVLQLNKMLWYAIQNNWIHGITWLWRTSRSRLKHMFFRCDAEAMNSQDGCADEDRQRTSKCFWQWWKINMPPPLCLPLKVKVKHLSPIASFQSRNHMTGLKRRTNHFIDG